MAAGIQGISGGPALQDALHLRVPAVQHLRRALMVVVIYHFRAKWEKPEEPPVPSAAHILQFISVSAWNSR